MPNRHKWYKTRARVPSEASLLLVALIAVASAIFRCRACRDATSRSAPTSPISGGIDKRQGLQSLSPTAVRSSGHRVIGGLAFLSALLLFIGSWAYGATDDRPQYIGSGGLLVLTDYSRSITGQIETGEPPIRFGTVRAEVDVTITPGRDLGRAIDKGVARQRRPYLVASIRLYTSTPQTFNFAVILSGAYLIDPDGCGLAARSSVVNDLTLNCSPNVTYSGYDRPLKAPDFRLALVNDPITWWSERKILLTSEDGSFVREQRRPGKAGDRGSGYAPGTQALMISGSVREAAQDSKGEFFRGGILVSGDSGLFDYLAPNRRVGMPPIGGPRGRGLQVTTSEGQTLNEVDATKTTLAVGSVGLPQYLRFVSPSPESQTELRWITDGPLSEGATWQIGDVDIDQRRSRLILAAGVLLGLAASLVAALVVEVLSVGRR